MTQDQPAAEVAATPEEIKVAIWRLDRELKAAMRFGARSNRQLHGAMLRDLRRAEGRAERAERRADQAERRADRAERELAEVRSSATWRAGRAVVAVPARIKRLRAR